MIFDDIDHHLALAGSIDLAAVPIGIYLAWCVNLGLVSEALLKDAEQQILRVRYRDASPADLLVSGCGGRIESAHLNERGLAFTKSNYQRYLTTYQRLFASQPYSNEDSWGRYDRIAPIVTGWLLGRSESRKPWWKFWS
ncbi:MAG: hypothetical protein O3A63_05340 [Proteobacteria bacterium]|nr:hypothetical protein [Pseudomonadota bacterium]